MEKLNVCVVFGGVSSEHEISKLSAATVTAILEGGKYNLHKIFIDRCGRWMYFDRTAAEICSCADGNAAGHFDRAIISPSRGEGIIRFRSDGTAEYIHIDVAVPVLHGKNGEDGTIQGLFELAGIPYVGSGVLGNAVCMDKCVAKLLFKEAGIPQADWVEVKRGQRLDPEEVEEKLGYPCFIKPSNAGSSVGISKAHNREELIAGVETAFEQDYKVLIEEFVDASEVESAVIGNLEPEVAECVGEIAPANEFYDFDAKYNDANSRLIIPAEIDADTEARLKAYALRAYRICECRGLSRVDFFVNKATGEVRLNEINTLPGFTSISMYPKMWECSGVSNEQLLDRLIALAADRKD